MGLSEETGDLGNEAMTAYGEILMSRHVCCFSLLFMNLERILTSD